MGDGRAEGSLAIGGGGQAAVSFTVDVAGADSVSLLDSSLFQFVSVTQSCPTLCHPMNRSTPGLPVHHQLPEFTQTHVHWVGDAKKMIQWCLGSMPIFIFFLSWWHDSTELGSEWLLQSSCTVLHSGPMSQKLIMPPQVNKTPLPFPAPWVCWVFLVLLLPLVSLHPFSGPPISSGLH